MTGPRRVLSMLASRLVFFGVLSSALPACTEHTNEVAPAVGSSSASDNIPGLSEATSFAEKRRSIAPEPADGWPTYGGQPSGTQYSSLDEINLGTVAGLKQVWMYRTGEISTGSVEMDATVYEMTPIFANEKLYVCTPLNRIIALAPDTGEELWRFDPGKPLTGTMYGSHNCRGVSYWAATDEREWGEFCGKRVFETAQHGILYAVDADTGEPCRGFGDAGAVDLNRLDYKGDGRIESTSPPAIYRDVVIVGGTVIDNKWQDSLDGIVRGFDARTGQELWSWNPIPEHLSDKIGGANTWAPIAVDQARGWVFLPTGSPSYDVYGANRHEPVPFGNAVVVLDALTGEVLWSYQTVHHDLWDYDLASMPTLVNVERGGQTIPAVLQATKMGFVFLLDRLTGEPLFPVEERPVPQSDVPGENSSATQPFPRLPAPVTSQSVRAEDAWGAVVFDRKECRDKLENLRNDGIYTPPSIEGSLLHPSFLGGTNWGGVAYDQASGIAVLNSANMVASVTLLPREEYDPAVHKNPGVSVYEMRGSPYVLLREMLLSSLGAPCNPPPWGSLTALDMTTGMTRWQIPFGRVEFGSMIKTLPAWGSPNQGGPIITKGGLIFIGASLDSRFRAYDVLTGEEVWSAEIPAPATATPMTYAYGPEKHQYVVVAAGGHGSFETKISDAIVAFALDSR